MSSSSIEFHAKVWIDQLPLQPKTSVRALESGKRPWIT